MAVKLYNTITGKIDELVPGGTKKDRVEEYPPVSIYSCGPTVYSFAHIGNLRTFMFTDLLRRYLKFRGFTVNHAMNITDVDDKTIRGALEENIPLKEYTDKYINIFFEDLKALNIELVEHYPRATDSIDSMVDIIKALYERGIVYEKEGSLYYSISKFAGYGRLSRLEAREINPGARCDTDEYDKDDARDFVLWKAPKENEIFWNTPYGPGRPGWHIECSAMVRKIFKGTIDIHTGGVDLIFPHHENEIAQSEAAYGETFARHWVHSEHLLVNGAKMSKSLGNFYTLRDLLGKKFSARAIRYLLLSAHYRKQLNFTFEGISQAEQALARIDNLIVRVRDIKSEKESHKSIRELIQKLYSEFFEAMDDDLNISRALGLLFDFIHDINTAINEERLTQSDSCQILGCLENLDTVFGFIFFPESRRTALDTERIEGLISERNEAKRLKNFKRSDEIRDMLLKENIILEDTRDGTRWKIKN